jgi:hypothetical protein
MAAPAARARDRGAVPSPDQLSFACPRCRTAVADRFYGPCPACRTALRATMGNDARDVVREDYEPSMHVTPNAVALKE